MTDNDKPLVDALADALNGMMGLAVTTMKNRYFQSDDRVNVAFAALDRYRAQKEAEPNLVAAVMRADKLINWMAGYIGKMAPGNYHSCYADLNEHGLFMERLGVPAQAKDNG